MAGKSLEAVKREFQSLGRLAVTVSWAVTVCDEPCCACFSEVLAKRTVNLLLSAFIVEYIRASPPVQGESKFQSLCLFQFFFN